MLVTRQREVPEQSHWQPFENNSRSLPRSSTTRMSEKQNLPLPVEPDWQGQYSFPPQVDSDAFPRTFTEGREPEDQSNGRITIDTGLSAAQPRTFMKDEAHNRETASGTPQFSPQRSAASTSAYSPSPISRLPSYTRGVKSEADPYAFPKAAESNNLHYRTQAEQPQGSDLSQSDRYEKEHGLSQEGDFDVDDEEADDGADDGSGQHQSVAERLAARRKMKRFRLTHQQTRFLMSEFAKQPHPDAAHRERLSREIPGLSPRQVQVWFQNRRAKIKRLTADDRDRMIRMRAVPDDFDNVQALHSPYGAVQGVPPNTSPTVVGPGPSPSSYRPHGTRPLLLDMRRTGQDSYMSPTGLSQSFGGIELGQGGAMGGSDVTSSPNPLYHDRYAPSTPSQHTPGLGGYHRSPSSYWNSSAGAMDSASQSGRPGLRESNSMPNREWNPRSAPGSASASMGSYQTGMDDSAQNRGRSATTSNAGPLGVDYGFSRDSYRPVGLTSAPQQLHDRNQALPSLRANIESSSGPGRAPLSAPLSAPVDVPANRSFPVPGGKDGDYSAAQMSAPITAPSEFNRTFPSPTTGRASNSGPLKDLFGNGVL